MARGRGGLDLHRIVTLGETVPKSVGGILIAMLLATVAAMMSRSAWGLLCLDGGRIWSGQVWRLVTWVLPQGSDQSAAITLLFNGFMLHWLGRDLAYTWSERRFLQVFFGYAAWAAGWTAFLGLIWDGAYQLHVGAWPVLAGLLVGWGLGRAGAQIQLFGIVPMTGQVFAWIIVGGTVLYAITSPTGPGEYVPHASSIALAFLLHAGLTPRRLWLRAKHRWLEGRLRRGRSHLRAVSRDDKPKWMN
jgi:hypothetical protein